MMVFRPCYVSQLSVLTVPGLTQQKRCEEQDIFRRSQAAKSQVHENERLADAERAARDFVVLRRVGPENCIKAVVSGGPPTSCRWRFFQWRCNTTALQKGAGRVSEFVAAVFRKKGNVLIMEH